MFRCPASPRTPPTSQRNNRVRPVSDDFRGKSRRGSLTRVDRISYTCPGAPSLPASMPVPGGDHVVRVLDQAGPCGNCGAVLTGPWCAACGQKVLSDSDRRFGHLLGQFAHEAFHADGKLPRTLAALLFRPGALSIAYLNGQRLRYISPIGLFLMINLVYFLAPPMTDFNLSLADQINIQPYSGLIEPLVQARVESRQVELADYARAYGASTERLAKTLIILHLPLLALVLMLAFPRRPLYYAEHFVVATHLFSFLLLLALVAGPLRLALGHLATESFDAMALFRLIWRLMPLVFMAWWLVALRRIYQTGWPRAGVTLVIWLIGLVVTHMLVYRPAQFLLVFAVT